jgi:hypothetical protein
MLYEVYCYVIIRIFVMLCVFHGYDISQGMPVQHYAVDGYAIDFLLGIVHGYVIIGDVCDDVHGYVIIRNGCATFRSSWFCH